MFAGGLCCWRFNDFDAKTMVINIASDIYAKKFHWHISKIHEITMRVRLFLIPQRQFHDINVMRIKLKEKIYRARSVLPNSRNKSWLREYSFQPMSNTSPYANYKTFILISQPKIALVHLCLQLWRWVLQVGRTGSGCLSVCLTV